VSWRGTLVAILAAGLAICFLLFSDRSRTHSSSEPLLGIDPAAVERIEIQDGGRKVTLLGKDGEWTIQGTSTDRADPAFVHAFLSKASELVPLDVLRSKELNGAVSLEALDLKMPRRFITVIAGKSRRLSLGVAGPTAGQIYARLDSDKEVFLISSELERLASLPEETLRDPRLTMLSPEHLSEIMLSRNGGLDQLLLRKNSAGWSLAAPTSVAADAEAASTWAKTLLGAKVERWMPSETDPTTYGLDSPQVWISARAEGAKEPVTISIGSTLPGSTDKFFVRCSDRPGICVVSGIAKALQVTPAALRSKQLKQIELDAVDKVQIDQPKGITSGTNSPGPVVLTRKPGGEDWEIRSGGTGILSGDEVRTWYEGLMQAKASGFEAATPEKVGKYGLDNPTEIRLVAHLSENTAEENAVEIVLGDYFLGRPSNGVVVLREGASPEFMIMPASVLSPIVKTPATAPSPEPVPSPAN